MHSGGETGFRSTAQSFAHLNAPDPSQWARMSGTPKPIAGVNQDLQLEGMRQRNPGSLGLIEGPRVKQENDLAGKAEPLEQLAKTQAGKV